MFDMCCAWRVACTRRGINPPSLRDEFARRERGEWEGGLRRGFYGEGFPKGRTLSHYLKGEGVPIPSTEKREELKQEMGAWLGGLAPWDAFATWTFSRIVTAQGAMFWAKRHITWIEKAAEQPV